MADYYLARVDEAIIEILNKGEFYHGKFNVQLIIK